MIVQLTLLKMLFFAFYRIQKMTGSFRSCAFNNVQLFEGFNVTNTSSLIDTICTTLHQWSSNMPIQKTRFVSSGNKMAIKYLSNSPFPVSFQAAVGFTYGMYALCNFTLTIRWLLIFLLISY